ncbi:MAG: putative toxin-antitoxin system toxin component, PIN family [Paludibacteraceae bacterium]|nr:putative toxin-antitoxin system toxin component, PIN family [Paludibacteraceae bacterium]
MRVVLDTNIICQIILPGLYNYDVWERFLDGDYTICYSNDILLEYEEILTKRYSYELAVSFIDLLKVSPNAQEVRVYFKLGLITADVDDNKFSDCAFAANATYIVSDDRHFNELDQIDFPKIEVLKLKDFKGLLLKSTTI